MLLGGLVGGLLVAAVGGSAAFVINAVSFLFSAALVSRIKGAYRAAPVADEEADPRVSAGIRLILRNQGLRLTLAATSIGLLGTGMINVAEYPLFVHKGGGSQAFGAAVSGWALGGIDGASQPQAPAAA